MMIGKYAPTVSLYSYITSLSQFRTVDSFATNSKLDITRNNLDIDPAVDDQEDQYTCNTKSGIEQFDCHNETFVKKEISKPQLRDPLHFRFTGYTIWLEFEEESFNFDLSRAISKVSEDLGLLPIPSPHVTAIYGMTHLSLEEVIEKWNLEVKSKIRSWPEFMPSGLIVDVERAGIDGGLMDMAWAEISYKTSLKHESKIDDLCEIFFDEDANERSNMRPTWKPHLSLAYDNPENHVLSLNYITSLIFNESSLTNVRKVKNISLWSTCGKMSEWELLDRYTLDE